MGQFASYTEKDYVIDDDLVLIADSEDTDGDGDFKTKGVKGSNLLSQLVVDDLVSDDTDKPLSAKQGKTLQDTKRATADGYLLSQTIYYTSGATWTKASYPGLKAVKVKCQGAGGGGGGVGATAAGTFVASGGGGGGGGGYAEKFILEAALDATEAIAVGTGGAGGAAGANNGSAGGNSTFGATKVIGNGGVAGNGATAQTFWITAGGGAGGSGTGDLVVAGGAGGLSHPVDANGGYGGKGGDSFLGKAPVARSAWQSSGAGLPGSLYGTGGSGGASAQNQTAKAGGAGANGIVIVEIYI